MKEHKFKKLTDKAKRYSESTRLDEQLLLYDLWGSEAHLLMLAKKRIVSRKEAREILFCLGEIRREYLKGEFKLKPELEDVHSNIESHIIDCLGIDVGGKLHTARSRNDQVLVDTKMKLREKLLDLTDNAVDLQAVLLDLASTNTGTVMPGFTHSQHAMPVTLGFWASGYASMLSRDLARLSDAYCRVNTNPLGACALAGTSFPIDRNYTTKLLGFDSVHGHALDVVSSRDFVIESLSCTAILMANLSKIAEELVLWSTPEFGFVKLSDAYTTGSSIMPQKRNPDMAELLRGRVGRVYGALTTLLTTVKGLPSGYNRDLQEDKALLWDALDVVESSLEMISGMISSMKVNKNRLAEVAGGDYSTATELANYLVRKGVSFREAHEIVSKLVDKLVKYKKDLTDYKTVEKLLTKQGVKVKFTELKRVLDPKKCVESYQSMGSSSSLEVKRMINKLGKENKAYAREAKQRRNKIMQARSLTEKEIKKLLS